MSTDVSQENYDIPQPKSILKESENGPDTENTLYQQNTHISAVTNRLVSDGAKTESVNPEFWCAICLLKLNTPLQAIQHFTGKSHANKSNKKKIPDKNAKKNFVNQKNQSAVGTTNNEQASSNKRPYDSGYFWRPESYQALTEEPAEKKSKFQLSTSDPDVDKQLVCNDCDSMFSSVSQAQQHFKGKKHALNVAAKSTAYKKVPVTSSQDQTFAVYHCQACDISLNSPEQYKQHCSGIRHKMKAGIIKEVPEWWVEQQAAFDQTRVKRSSGKGVAEQYKCDICDVLLNSEFQLGQHLSSKKHKENEEAKSTGGRGRGSSRGRGRGRGNSQRGGGFNRGRGQQRGSNRGRGAQIGRGRGSSHLTRGGKGNRAANNGGRASRGRGRGYSDTGAHYGNAMVNSTSPNFMPIGTGWNFGGTVQSGPFFQQHSDNTFDTFYK